MSAQSTPTYERSAKELVIRESEFVNGGQFDRLGEVLAEDVVIEWPQSSERVRGIANFRAILENAPGGNLQASSHTAALFPESDEERFETPSRFKLVETEGYEDSATSVVKNRYRDGSEWFVISVVRASRGKIVQLVQYFAPLYDPPEWRAQWVEYTQD